MLQLFRFDNKTVLSHLFSTSCVRRLESSNRPLSSFNIRFKKKLKPISTKFIALSLFSCSALISQTAFAEDSPRVLKIYNWSDYIAPNTLANFEKETGIKVTYDVYDSNELLESKLMAGNTGFDLVVPTSNFIAKQIDIGIYQPLDKNKLVNLDKLDPNMMALLAKDDPDNTYAMPYMWAASGIGYNVTKLNEIFKEGIPDGWSLIFDEANASKLQTCGITWLNAPEDMFSMALTYLGLDPNSENPDDYKKAAEMLAKVRPYVKYIHSSSYISDLANGDVCVSVGYGGDLYQSISRAKEANRGVELNYFIPKEGTLGAFDALVIPKDAQNVDEAYEFLNYLQKPEVIAEISDYVFYANANLDAKPLMNQEIVNNPNIYPPKEILEKIYSLSVKSPKTERTLTRLWTDVITTK
ncbi:polyamine ABC transporter substrate-binding protein [Thorsellia kenyensis]|uniref:Putrescine-binding periplasmic protein n=1 Tax=Thorsellia kenyensis TaxID=1549888 RepID=A0ABV6C7G3_9GAMM